MQSKLPSGLNKTIFNGRKIKSTIVLIVFVLAFNTNSFAEKPDPWTGPIVNTPGSDNNSSSAHPPHSNAPIDSGVVVLIAACVGYGFIRTYKNQRMISFKAK